MEIKDNILKVAFKLFIERGFFEVSIKDLIEEARIAKNDFYDYFKNKDKLITEVIDKFFFQRFNDVFVSTNKSKESSKEKLFRIFQKYSETESYLKNNIGVEKINYKSILFLIIKGIKIYETMANYVNVFNNRLLEKVESIIEEGKVSGEILNVVDSKSTSASILTLLQNSILLWAMNQNINIIMLFKTDFKYLWNSIKASESSSETMNNNIVDAYEVGWK